MNAWAFTCPGKLNILMVSLVEGGIPYRTALLGGHLMSAFVSSETALDLPRLLWLLDRTLGCNLPLFNIFSFAWSFLSSERTRVVALFQREVLTKHPAHTAVPRTSLVFSSDKEARPQQVPLLWDGLRHPSFGMDLDICSSERCFLRVIHWT